MTAGFFSFKATVDTLTPALGSLHRQMPFALALATTRTGQAVKRSLQLELARVFEKPTRFTTDAVATISATKSRPVFTLFIKDGGKGTPAEKYLKAEIEGGPRRAKRFERALQSRGILPAGWYAVPGRFTQLDAYGNTSGALATQILSDLGAFGEQGYTANRVTKRRARESGGASKYKRASKYFAIRPGQKGTPGVYKILADGQARLVFVFVSSASYAKRFDFQGISQREAARIFPQEYSRAWDQALRTAR